MIKNNKGFAITEILIISTVVIGVLVFMYTQFKSINRSYQYSFRYDTVEGLYLANNILQYIKDNEYDKLVNKLEASEQKYLELEDCDPETFSTSSFCDMLFTKSKVDKVIFTKENLRELKVQMTDFDQELQNYINQIQTSNNENDYRIIIKYQDGTYASLKFNKSGTYIEEGLIAYLDAINNTGDGHSNDTILWKDLSGYNNDAILYNNPTWSDYSITFNGVDNYGKLENTANMTYQNGVTLEARVKILTLAQGTNQEFFGNWNAAGLGLIYNNSNQQFYSSMYANGAWQSTQWLETINNLNEYYTVTTTYNNSEHKLYINGKLVRTDNRGNNVIITPTSVPFAIGGNPNTLGMDNYTNVEFQNILIYNRALSENEVLRNYQADMSRY